MKTKEEILNDIKKMLFEDHPEIEITMDTFLEYGEGSFLDMSSIEIVDFIVKLETKYDIIVDIDDRYYTVGDAVLGVVGYLEEKARSEVGGNSESEV